MLWLVGLAAVVLTAGTTRMARPAWIVLGASIFSTSVFGSAEHLLVRNTALLVATIDASVAMIWMLRRPTGAAREPGLQRPSPPTPVSSQPR